MEPGEAVSQEAARIEQEELPELPIPAYIPSFLRDGMPASINDKAYRDPADAKTACDRMAFKHSMPPLAWTETPNGFVTQDVEMDGRYWRFQIVKITVV